MPWQSQPFTATGGVVWPLRRRRGAR